MTKTFQEHLKDYQDTHDPTMKEQVAFSVGFITGLEAAQAAGKQASEQEHAAVDVLTGDATRYVFGNLRRERKTKEGGAS